MSVSQPKVPGTRSWAWPGGLACFLLALLVRIPGIAWGLPNAGRWYSYHPDESIHQVVGALFRLLEGGWDPHYFNYPSLSIYLSLFVYQAMALLGITTSPTTGFPWPLIHDLILAGRILSVCAGAGCAWVAFLLGTKLQGQRCGWWAGAFVALCPGLVQHSHFATVDVPATFMTLLCVLLSTGPRTRGQLLAAAFVAGLAAATKYNAGAVLVAPLAALWWPTGPSAPAMEPARSSAASRGIATVLLVLTATGGFLLGCPYALLNFKEFWSQGFAYELLVHPREGSGDLFTHSGNRLWYLLTFNLPFLMTWPLLLAGMLGAVAALRSAQRRLYLPLMLFLLAFGAPVALSQVRFMRYGLPLAVPLCLLAAALPGFVIGAELKTKSRLWPWLLPTLGVFSLIGTFNVLQPLLMVDPRDQAADFVRSQSPTNQPIRYGLMSPPWFTSPPLNPTDRTLAQFANAFPSPKVRNILIVVAPAALKKMATKGALPDWYLVNEFETRETQRLDPGAAQAQQQTLFSTYAGAVLFKNRPWLDLPGREYVPHDFLYTNPQVTAYMQPATGTGAG